MHPSGSQKSLEENMRRLNDAHDSKAAEEKQRLERKRDRRETLRFWLTFGTAALAAIAAIGSFLMQILKQ